ncbi:S-layer homology domain-containing protein [uncultured Mitsuokella sp.]|uniref:S-layer homology domain-containing protein n=1 Tax=uncultured Mitsuokella sp. TaxID=453120 RepID=UPI002674A5DD|nr:S-layer homology domain-containing protein [uncultured Mitsuokella sp.]
MKKTLVSALTTALVVGAASTTFAAANPFSDVPADHWAYDAVSQLAADGVIEGYGDTTFRGNQNITRYEMAQMIAKAMAKSDVSAADKALIDKLAAEFSDELNNLGVRVSNLERNADNVKWTGEARYRYWSNRVEDRDASGHNGTGKDKQNKDRLKFRLEPSAEVNSNWHVNARLDADLNTSKDNGADGDVTLARVYAQGDYKNFQVKLGKQALFSTETNGLILDDDFSGAQVTFGKDFKTTLEAGRWDLDRANDIVSAAAAKKDSAANYQGIAFGYAPSKLTLGAAYRHFGSNAFTEVDTYKNGKSTSDDANIWSVGAGYKFDKNWNLEGAFAKNDEADNYETAHNIQLSYKGADKVNAGTWGMYGAYRYLGENVAFAPTYDTFMNNTKGWEVGADYTPFHNVYTAISYFDGKQLVNDKDAKLLFGRVSYFF